MERWYIGGTIGLYNVYVISAEACVRVFAAVFGVYLYRTYQRITQRCGVIRCECIEHTCTGLLNALFAFLYTYVLLVTPIKPFYDSVHYRRS